MITPEALDLLSKMLVYDKNLRIRCKEAMAHAYFDPIRNFIKEQKEKKKETKEKMIAGETTGDETTPKEDEDER